MYLGPTTQSYRNVCFLQLAASFGEKNFFDADPVGIRSAKYRVLGMSPGAKPWEIKEIKKM